MTKAKALKGRAGANVTPEKREADTEKCEGYDDSMHSRLLECEQTVFAILHRLNQLDLNAMLENLGDTINDLNNLREAIGEAARERLGKMRRLHERAQEDGGEMLRRLLGD